MTVNEMHIAVNLGVQKLASFQVDNLLPQEIDHELNLAMMRFIKQRYNATSNRLGRGFEQSQKRIDDLRTLVVEHTGYTNYEGLTFTSNYSDIYIDRYTLPLDYLFLVSVRSDINYVCNTPITNLVYLTPLVYSMVRLELTPPTDGYVLTGIERWNSTSSTWELVTNSPLGEEIVFESLVNNETYNFGITPSTSFPDQASLGNTVHVTPVLNSNHLYLNSTSWTLSTSGSYIRAIWVQEGNMSTAQYVEHDYIKTIQKNYRQAVASFRISLCKFAQHDDIIFMLDDPFNRTDYKTPLYTIEENYIDIHTDNEFVVPKVTIKYIRRPDSININDGIGCELPEHTHNEIVEMTIKSILEGIQDPRYQTQTMETFESE